MDTQTRAPLGVSSKPNMHPNVTEKVRKVAKSHMTPEQRLALAEQKIEQLIADKARLANQREDLQTELRLAAQKHDKLKASLDKAKGSNAKYTHLATRLEELQKVHEASKATREAEIATVRQELREAMERVEGERRQADQERRARQQSEVRIADVEREARTWEERARQVREELRGGREAQHEALLEMKQELQEVVDVAEELRGQNRALVGVACRMAEELSEERERSRELELHLEAQRMELEATRSEADERGELMRECMELVTQLARQKEVYKYEAAEASWEVAMLLARRGDGESTVAAGEPERFGNDDGEDLRDVDDRMAALTRDVHEAQQQDAQALGAALVSVAEALRCNASVVRSAVETSKVTEERLSHTTEALAEAQRASEAMASTRDNLVAQLAKLQVADKQRQANADRLEKENKSLGEANKSLGTALGHARSKENALNEQVEGLTEALDAASSYQSAYEELVRQTQLLVSRNALAESDAEILSALNAQLASQANPNQRILYLERVRTELSEVKQALLIACQERDEVRLRVRELEEEMRIFRAVEVPLNEKPRTKMTRVMKATVPGGGGGAPQVGGSTTQPSREAHAPRISARRVQRFASEESEEARGPAFDGEGELTLDELRRR